ncbi:uncharacterized protein LOC110462254 isoform X2 [Mizuhopecten yessoensis]|uniref:uncharacterized protein LOC110462254 isoform X2 n=1 Tax=Mizuhopecten yessoensis TaxID=6573 RepID=UPI000B45C4F1|nr:uncharacterized protein LOC110462254 isoform X2 [Mizuhopecten yessoensis]
MEAKMEVQSAEVQSLIAKAFHASESGPIPTAGSSTEQYLVIPPDHVNEEVIVIDTAATEEQRVTRFRVANQPQYGIQKVEPEGEEEQSTDQPMDYSTPSEMGEGEIAAASSIMAIQAASSTKPLTFEVIESASQRGLPKLMDSLGYGYTLRRTSNITIRRRGKQKGKKEKSTRVKKMYWRCAVRGRQYSCGAGVVQEGDDVFIRNDQPHGHLPKPDGLQQVKIRKQVKMLAKRNMLDTGPSVVNSVLLDNAEGDVTECSRSLHANLVRTANRIREKLKEKVELTMDEMVKNVYEYFQTEERSGSATNLAYPMKRLSEATGLPTRQLKKKLGLVNEKEIAIKRCVGGEIVKTTRKAMDNEAENAITAIVEDFERKDENFSVVDLMDILKVNYPIFTITRAVVGRVLRKLGYQIRNSRTVFEVDVEKKPKKENEVIKLVRSR